MSDPWTFDLLNELEDEAEKHEKALADLEAEYEIRLSEIAKWAARRLGGCPIVVYDDDVCPGHLSSIEIGEGKCDTEQSARCWKKFFFREDLEEFE